MDVNLEKFSAPISQMLGIKDKAEFVSLISGESKGYEKLNDLQKTGLSVCRLFHILLKTNSNITGVAAQAATAAPVGAEMVNGSTIGPPGPQGVPGIQGFKGENGERGERGEKGESGIINNEDTAYLAHDCVNLHLVANKTVKIETPKLYLDTNIYQNGVNVTMMESAIGVSDNLLVNGRVVYITKNGKIKTVEDLKENDMKIPFGIIVSEDLIVSSTFTYDHYKANSKYLTDDYGNIIKTTKYIWTNKKGKLIESKRKPSKDIIDYKECVKFEDNPQSSLSPNYYPIANSGTVPCKILPLDELDTRWIVLDMINPTENIRKILIR